MGRDSASGEDGGGPPRLHVNGLMRGRGRVVDQATDGRDIAAMAGWNGSSWTEITAASGLGDQLFDISCPSAAFCVIPSHYRQSGLLEPVSYQIATYTDMSTFTDHQVPVPEGGVRTAVVGVSCPTDAVCMGVASPGGAIEREHAGVWQISGPPSGSTSTASAASAPGGAWLSAPSTSATTTTPA